MTTPDITALPDGAALEPDACDPAWTVIHEFAREYRALVERTGLRLQIMPTVEGCVLTLVRSQPGAFTWLPEFDSGPLH